MAEQKGTSLEERFAAIDEAAIPEPHASVMRQYFERFSLAMVNTGSDADEVSQRGWLVTAAPLKKVDGAARKGGEDG